MKSPHLFLLLLLVVCSYACRQQHPAIPLVTSRDYEKGESFLNVKNDSAFYYFNKVASSSKDSLQIAMAYGNMADIQSDAGDYFGSQESLLASLRYLHEEREKDRHCLLADYNELGSSSLDLKNYEVALGYYNEALRFAKDDDFKTIALNNKAVAYQKMGQYAQAITIYRSVINQSKTSKKEYARILSNLAKNRWQQDSGYRAAPDLLLALQIRKDAKDDWGLNASYAHLADYYFHSHPDSALIYAGKMYDIAKRLNSPDDELEALQKLIVLSPAKAIKQYFILYHSLSDSLQTSRNTAKNQFALIRYEAEKNKADNLRLQKDNTEKRIQILWQLVIIGGVSCFFIMSIIVVISRYRKRQQRMRLESENILREHQLKTSKKVHDVVANGLYRIMTAIEHQEILDKEPLLDKIEALYEQSRDISYEQFVPVRNDFQEFIAELLTSFASADTKVLVAGNEKEVWHDVTDHAKKELEHVLQELMINMKKHSQAQNVAVRFERHSDYLTIQYKDDGIGLPPEFHHGNGLTNTGNRIKDMGGRIIFDKNTLKGLKIEVFLPIA